MSMVDDDVMIMSDQFGSTPGFVLKESFTLTKNHKYIIRVTGCDVVSGSAPFIWLGDRVENINLLGKSREYTLGSTVTTVTAVYIASETKENVDVGVLTSLADLGHRFRVYRLQFFEELIEDPYEITATVIKSTDGTGVAYVRSETLTNNARIIASDSICTPALCVSTIQSSDMVDILMLASDGITVNGNLNVQGVTVSLETTTTTLQDPIVTLGLSSDQVSNDDKDRGVEFKWHDNITPKTGFMGYDNSQSKFVFLPDAVNSDEVFSGALGDIAAATIEASDLDAGTIDAVNIRQQAPDTSFYMLLPTGTVLPYAGSTTPGGYLICDGSAISRTTYATLFSVIATTYGAGNGSTTFNLPNLVNRMIYGADESVGITSGNSTATLTNDNLPSHSHSITIDSGGAHTHSIIDPGHSHSFGLGKDDGNLSHSANQYPPGDSNDIDYTLLTTGNFTGISIDPGGAHTHTASAASTGNGAAFSILNPHMRMHFIIKI